MQRASRIVLALCSWLALLACLVGGEAGTWLFAAATPPIPVALIGAATRATRGLTWLLVGLAVSLEAGVLGVLLLDRWSIDAPRALGLPPATLLALLAIGVVPLLLVPLGYARWFGRGREEP